MTGEMVHGRDLPEGFDESADVVVVGSGAGGAVVAAHAAEAGRRVLVLEEGPHYTHDQIASFRPTEAMRRMWREGGMLAAFGVGRTPVIGLTVGRNVGGSSVHTGGVCFRVPSWVHAEWVRDHGLDELSERALEAAYDDVERRVSAREVPIETRSLSTSKFLEGAARLGITMRPLTRNTSSCVGNGVCNFGCPSGAKMSVDRSYLPSAVAHGARVISDALVERVTFEGERATGVVGTLLAGTRKRRFRVRAPTVVVACGTLHTPLLLGASGVRNANAGQHITLHPAARMSALFDDTLRGWDGALQSVFSDQFAGEGVTLVGVYTAVNLLAVGLPGAGPAHRELVRKMPQMGVFGAMIHDEGGGVVRPSLFGREGIVSYEMAPRDLVALRRSITILGEIAFAAGAREVFPPIFGAGAVRDLAALRRLETDPIDPRRIECLAFHPLGSARIASDPRRGVTDPEGRVFGTRGLYVADGSVLPTSIAVNSQVPIMAMATRIAWRFLDRGARAA